MGLTVDELYESYLDDEQTFAEDVWEAFGSPMGATGEYAGTEGGSRWAADFQEYLPEFDPTKIGFGERDRDIAIQDAEILLEKTNIAAENVYATETSGISSKLKSEINKGKELAGRLGLKTGDMESAIDTTIYQAQDKVKDLGSRLKLVKDEADQKLDHTKQRATLDFDKTTQEAKQDFYDRTLTAINNLTKVGAFEDISPEEYDEILKNNRESKADFKACKGIATAPCNVYCIGTGDYGIGISKSCVNRCKESSCHTSLYTDWSDGSGVTIY